MLKEGIAQKYIFSVVLDGSNIIHGGYRCDNADGNRLLSAYNYFRSKGYVVFVIVKTGTLTYMSPEGLDGEQNGWSALEEMGLHLCIIILQGLEFPQQKFGKVEILGW